MPKMPRKTRPGCMLAIVNEVEGERRREGRQGERRREGGRRQKHTADGGIVTIEQKTLRFLRGRGEDENEETRR